MKIRKCVSRLFVKFILLVIAVHLPRRDPPSVPTMYYGILSTTRVIVLADETANTVYTIHAVTQKKSFLLTIMLYLSLDLNRCDNKTRQSFLTSGYLDQNLARLISTGTFPPPSVPPERSAVQAAAAAAAAAAQVPPATTGNEHFKPILPLAMKTYSCDVFGDL